MKKIFLHTMLIISAISLANKENENEKNFWKPDMIENITDVGTKWKGIGPNGEEEGSRTLNYTRIPSLIITDDNKLVTMFDLRWDSANDHSLITPGVAISEDGGYTWTKKTAFTFNESTDNRRRIMDPTMLYDNVNDTIYALHGSWKSGSQNWYADRKNYYEKDIWAARIHKSTDGGKTWVEDKIFSKNENTEVFKNHNLDNPVLAFLGGVGTGTVMKNGTLVFPIQTSHNDLIGATIMYSEDQGKTWKMPENAPKLMPNGSSLENMVFELGDKLILTGRGNNRWAYSSTDMGQTWQPYEPINGFSGTSSQPTQGSSIYVTLPNGRKVVLVSKPNGNNDSWQRGNISLWALDGLNKNNKIHVTTFRPFSGNKDGAGYSSLAYKDGNLFVAFEDNGNIIVKNLTSFIKDIENKTIEWGLEDERAKDIDSINRLENLPKEQKDRLIKNLMLGNDNRYIVESIALNREIGELIEDIETLVRNKEENFSKALPSKLREFKEEKELTEEQLKYSSVKGIRQLKNNMNNSYKALNTEINFNKYIDKLNLLNFFEKDIYDNFNKNIYTNYIYENISGINNHQLNLGGSFNIKDNIHLGAIAEYTNKNGFNFSIAPTLNIKANNINLNSFIRYRLSSINEIDSIAHNIDIYNNLGYDIKLNNNLKITPSFGIYTSFTKDVNIDEDAILNSRIAVSIDSSLKLEFSNKSFSGFVKPEISMIYNLNKLEQSNDNTKSTKLENKSINYNINLGIKKHFNNNLGIGTKINIGGNDLEKYNIKMSLGIDWNK